MFNFLRLFLLRPVIDPVNLKATLFPQIIKQFPQILIVGLILKLEILSIVQIHNKLIRKPLTQDIHRRRHLLFHNHRVFLFCVFGLHILPGQNPSEEIHQHISD